MSAFRQRQRTGIEDQYAFRSDLQPWQVGVSMRPRAGGAPSHNPWKAAVFLLRAFFALLISLSRPSAPLPEPVGEGARA